MLRALAVSLVLTLLLEEGFALAWGLRGRRELGLVALASCLTNPPAVLLHSAALRLLGPVWAAALVETGVVLVEWRCYRAFSEQVRRPLLFSLLANAFSYGVGCLITQL
ncbi:hypothetical protein AALC17_06135 [Oscillospiraceae bacterium 38-13]